MKTPDSGPLVATASAATAAGPYLTTYRLESLRVAPVTPAIGAAVSGCDLRSAMAGSEIEAIAEALRRHKVLFFRDQQALSFDELAALGRRFGTLQRYNPSWSAADRPGDHGQRHPEVCTFEYGESQRGREAFWHFDVAPGRKPARAALLRARVVPDVGGDTLFCDLTAVYDSLPPAMKSRLEGRRAVYDPSFARRLARFRGTPEAEVMTLSDEPLYEFPLIVRDPSGGRPALLVNPGFLVGIGGLSSDETAAIAADLARRVARPEFQCRFRWRCDDLAFWDNRACLHYATNNYWPARRVMDRVTIIDEAAAS